MTQDKKVTSLRSPDVSSLESSLVISTGAGNSHTVTLSKAAWKDRRRAGRGRYEARRLQNNGRYDKIRTVVKNKDGWLRRRILFYEKDGR